MSDKKRDEVTDLRKMKHDRLMAAQRRKANNRRRYQRTYARRHKENQDE